MAAIRWLSSRGGRANEAGSLYRSGVAAYLAAHGLAGRGVEAAGYPEQGPAPVSLAFETGDAVDDVRCGLADGTTLWLQAKRTCGADAQLQATVAQWAGQASQLQPGDKVGLATAQAKGDVRYLGQALDRGRRAVPGQFPPGEARALDAVRARLPAGTPESTTARVLDAAVVMEVAASTARDEGFRFAAVLLDGRVVPAGSGSRAVAVLQHAFQEQAAAGTGSDLDEWLQILADAGVEVIPEGDGLGGQRRRAELDAVAAHWERLADNDGKLWFSLLAENVPPMRYPRLADSLRVSVPEGDRAGDEFLTVARRWPRMLLTGLPGMGKSTALEQAAARWAAEAHAPVPILVPLREIARREPQSPSEVTLPVLIEVAAATAPEHQQSPLRRALEHAAASGAAVLLLDGLDECRERRSLIADGLADTLNGVAPETGIVLATRASGLDAARKLGLPEAQLIPPTGLDSSFPAALLGHLADCRAVPAADRTQWVEQRDRKLNDVRRNHPDLWRVPLLATLLTLLVADQETAALPASRARLLADAVENTVRRWELSRTPGTASFPDLRADQLLSGYSEIGHAILTGPDTCPAPEVRQMVAGMLSSQWGKAPAEASALAREVMQFWDEHVGVFVASPVTGDIEPRSRVFAEVGEAMWIVRQDPETRRDQIAAALADQDNREPVVLAAILSPDVARELIGAADASASPAARTHALLWAADAVTADGAAPGPDPLRRLLHGLADAARQAAAPPPAGIDPAGTTPGPSAPRIPPGWPYIQRAATLPLPAALRPDRDSALATSDEYAEVLATALAALTDARSDTSATLSDSQAAAVSQLLNRPLPDQERAGAMRAAPDGPVRFSTGRSRFLPGHQLAAEQAAAYAAQLGDGAAAAMYRIAHRASVLGYQRIRDTLTAAGYHDPEPSGARLLSSVPIQAYERYLDQWKVFFEAAASLATPRVLSPAERWRYPDLATLAHVLDTGHASLDGIDHAFTTDQALLPQWIRAAAHAAGLDVPALAAEATAALGTWAADAFQTIMLILTPPPLAGPELDAAHLDRQDREALGEALGANSDWIAGVASMLLGPQ